MSQLTGLSASFCPPFAAVFHATGNPQRQWWQRCRRCVTVSAGNGTDGSSGSGQAGVQHPQRQRQPKRREVVLNSLQLVFLAEITGSDDGRTILNSVLGAYGLPQLKATKGFRFFDELDSPCTFEYPTAWVRRKNTLRQGIIISDFNTADNMRVEVFPEPPGGTTALAQAAVAKLINPAVEIGGDSRLELPPANRIKAETREIDGKVYTYLAFPSETITRSGYQVRRKNMAVAAARKGTVYVLGCSARSDQFDKEKEALFQHIVESFRVL